MAGLFFRIFQHLLPDAIAWRIRKGSNPWFWNGAHAWDEEGLTWGEIPGGRPIDRFFDALTRPFRDARLFVDQVLEDLYPSSTRQLPEWQRQFGLVPPVAHDDQVVQRESAWQEQGGQSPRYLQDRLQGAGFEVWIHEWWEPGSPVTDPPRNPRDYTEDPLFGTVQCGEPLAQCGEPTALCNGLLANEPGYLVNRGVPGAAPPPIPDDAAQWPFFLYWAGETFPESARVPQSRRAEFERLLLKLCPAHLWLVPIVDYVDDAEEPDAIAAPSEQYLWMRADTATLDGTDVDNVIDRFAGGVIASQATPADKPTYLATGAPNSRPSLAGDGVSKYLEGTDTWIPADTNFDVYFLVKANNFPNDRTAFFLRPVSLRTEEAPARWQAREGDTGTEVTSTVTGTIHTWVAGRIRYEDGAEFLRILIEGEAEQSVPVPEFSVPMNIVTFFASAFGGSPMNCELADVFAVAPATGAQHLAYGRYFRSRYGETVAAWAA